MHTHAGQQFDNCVTLILTFWPRQCVPSDCCALFAY